MNQPPQPRSTGIPPKEHVLQAGTPLYRVHDVTYPANSFNPNMSDSHWGGGRFDGTDQHPYSWLYTAGSPITAVLETFPEVPHDKEERRFLTQATLAGKRITAVETTVDLPLVSLRSAVELATVGLDNGWLLFSEARDYGYTRRWAASLREDAPDSCGLIWMTGRDFPQWSMVLFEDKCRPLATSPIVRPTGWHQDLWTADGIRYLNGLLIDYRMYVPTGTALP